MLPDSTKLLLVDDLEENLLALEALLRQEGVEIIKARSGSEALELLLRYDFALALLDVQMPHMDGFELAELMRGTERTRRVPIIFLTAVATDDRRRFRGYEAGAVDYLLKPIDPPILRAKVGVFLRLHRQSRELESQRDELKAATAQLGLALERLHSHNDNSPLAIVEFDADLQVASWSMGAERLFGWTAADVAGKSLAELPWSAPQDAEAFAAHCEDMRAGKSRRAVQPGRCHHKDGQLLDCEWYSSALIDASGRLVSIDTRILDVTERKHAEETQRLLIGELNHRVKNMLATVQAIAAQTLRGTTDAREFAEKFSGRIQSLARAHSLLSNAVWKGADLTTLVQDQLHLGALDEKRFRATGPEVYLAPETSLHIALVLHELTTNAFKYGALSGPRGRIELEWTVENGSLCLQWTECDGAAIKAPSRRGFGTVLIEQSAKAEGGMARVSYRADGLSWELHFPLLQAAQTGQTPVQKRSSAKTTEPEGRAVHPAAKLSGRKILIIEDEPLVAIDVADMLERAGAEVTGAAGSAEEAIRIIETTSIDGALLDGNLHGRPVDDVAAALTRHKVPFLFVSGYGRENLPQAFASAGLLQKPFNEKELVIAACAMFPTEGEVVHLRKLNGGAGRA